jgi:beta-phosphoglucomutase-like phosphatase (HAD superfamily)
MGASYTQLKSLDAKLDHLREARDTATDPDAIAAIDKKIDLLMPQYNALTAQMNRIGLAVDTDSASFQRFAKATAGADYPADVFDKEDGASRGQAFDHAIEKPTDVLNSLLQRAAAFREMLQNNDVDAINNYLRLQECENTSFKASS